jgi:hypothetical protein
LVESARAEAACRFNDPHRRGSNARPNRRARSGLLFLIVDYVGRFSAIISRENHAFYA